MADGSLSGGVNREGVRYYNNLIDELLSKGIPACLDPLVSLLQSNCMQSYASSLQGCSHS